MRQFLRTHGIALPPEEVVALQSAFDAAWQQLVADTASSPYKPDAKLRTELAQQIVQLREKGERDPNRVAALAIMHIMTPPAKR